MKRQSCSPAAWGYAGKQQVHPQETEGNIIIIETIEYLLTSQALYDGGFLWLTNPAHGLGGLTPIHGHHIPMWGRQTTCHSSLTTSWYHQNSLMSGLAMSNADKRHEWLCLCWKTFAQNCKNAGIKVFLNIYNFKLPRLKISSTYCPKRKKRQQEPYVIGSPPTTSALACKWCIFNITYNKNIFQPSVQYMLSLFLIDKCCPTDSKYYF